MTILSLSFSLEEEESARSRMTIEGEKDRWVGRDLECEIS